MANVFDQFDAAPAANPFDEFDATDVSSAPKLDKFQQAALTERAALQAQGIDTGAGLTRRLFQGATLGFGDELLAGLTTPLEMARHGTMSPAEGYNYGKARENLILDDARKNTGLMGTAAEGLGGLVTGGGLGKAGYSIAGKVAASAPLTTKIGAGALEGALYGGAYGAGEGEGTGGRLSEGAKSAALGGVVGGAFPVLSQGVSNGYRAFQNWRAGNEIAKQAGMSPEVLRMMGQALEADGTLGPQGVANMSRAGSEAMLADAGPNARTILDTAIQRGGPGAVQAREAIADRASRGANDLTAALDDVLGQPAGVTASQTAIRQGTSGARGTAYRAAYASPIDYASPAGQTLENLVTSRVPASVIRDANSLMRLEGNASKQILANVADDGTVSFQIMPDVRQIDYITRALNQAAESGEGAGALGGQTTLGRAYQNLSREIRDTLRSHVPAYDNALKVAADPIQQSKAIQFGAQLLSPSVTRDAAAEAIRGMTDAERRALAQGVRSNLDDAMARVSRTAMDGNTEAREALKGLKDLSSRANREKLALAIGPQNAERLFNEVDRVATSFELRSSVAENSKTFARQATDQRVKQITQPGPIGTAMQGEPINAAKRMVQLLTGKTPEKITAAQDRIYSEMAQRFTAPQADAVPLFNGLAKLRASDARAQSTANSIDLALRRAQPGIVYGTTTLPLSASQGRPEDAMRRRLFDFIMGRAR